MAGESAGEKYGIARGRAGGGKVEGLLQLREGGGKAATRGGIKEQT